MVNLSRNLAFHLSSMCCRAVFHDEAVYPNSHAFVPDRFLKEDGQLDPSVLDPESRVFGSGRRLVTALSIKVRVFSLRPRQDLPGPTFCGQSGAHLCCEDPSDLRYFTSGGREWETSATPGGVHQRPCLVRTEVTASITTDISYPNPSYSNSHPLPFECIVKPRSEQATILIAEASGRSS